MKNEFELIKKLVTYPLPLRFYVINKFALFHLVTVVCAARNDEVPPEFFFFKPESALQSVVLPYFIWYGFPKH